MLSIIIGFRNRDCARVENVLRSLSEQQNKDFELVFVDYGSDDPGSIKNLVESYSFTHYMYCETKGWLWNRGHAINVGVRAARGETIFISDIDNLYHPLFIERTHQLDLEGKFYTAGCYYLPENFDYNIIKRDPSEIAYRECYGMGLSIMKKDAFFKVYGYDEYFMVWGAEDDDLTTNLMSSGLERIHCKCQQLPMYHQWHPVSSPQKPNPWYLSMVDYLYNKSKDPMVAARGRWITIKDRPVLQKLASGAYKDGVKMEFCEDLQFLFFNPVTHQFAQLCEGEIAWLQYSGARQIPCPNKRNPLSRLFKSKPATVPVHDITLKDIDDFLNYFIGINRNKIGDYYKQVDANGVLFICQKQVVTAQKGKPFASKTFATA